MSKLDKIGFMQGRLSPMVGGKIQAFPWANWRGEFKEAEKTGFGLMEWTMDLQRLYENPLMTSRGRAEINKLKRKYGLSIKTITCDFFMQKPFFRQNEKNKIKCLKLLSDVMDAAIAMNLEYLIIPLVDQASIKNDQEELIVVDALKNLLTNRKIKIAFESDYSPSRLKKFIMKFPEDKFGINYDIGNSASLGYSPIEEFKEYGKRIVNVHIKDRKFNGSTVPLGCGNADLPSVFKLLTKYRYGGLYILQTARSQINNHAGVLQGYREIAFYLLKEAKK